MKQFGRNKIADYNFRWIAGIGNHIFLFVSDATIVKSFPFCIDAWPVIYPMIGKLFKKVEGIMHKLLCRLRQSFVSINQAISATAVAAGSRMVIFLLPIYL